MNEAINIWSEIGTLRRVLVHRPGEELLNLMPEHLDRLLFDDIPYLRLARQEHDRFAQLLTEQGVEVVYLLDLVTESITSPEARQALLQEFLAESGPDPRRALAERLCADIPMNTCVTAYNKAFECTRIRELAALFPDLAEHLLNIRDNIVDLLVPFQSGYYYNRAMGGSFSIKSVLPAIFPDDPSLD